MFDAIALDMDGVLYHGARRLDGVLEFFEWISVPYCFITNNSSKTPDQVADKLAKMGVQVSQEQIITSSLATAHYLQQHAPPRATVYAVGEVGLFTALESAKFQLVDHNPDYVVVGLDREFNDQKLQTAVAAIHAGATFIATNMDKILMTQDGARPGTGSIVQQIADIAGKSPLVMGKPQRQIFDMAAQQLNVPLPRMLMIGDNIDTDVRGALQHGMQAAFVLTGVSTQQDLQQAQLSPHFIAQNLLNLVRQIDMH